eukprot:498030_1
MNLNLTVTPSHEAYNGAACISCMSPNDGILVTCSACKRAKYCNKTCQKKNWKEHKVVCKVLQSFQKMLEGLFEDDDFAPIKGLGRMGLIEKFRYFKRLMEKRHLKESPVRDLAKILQFPNNVSENAWTLAKNLVQFSPCCSICDKTKYEQDIIEMNNPTIAKTSWKCCPTCKFGWSCSDHFDEYQQKHTPEICKSYVESIMIERFRYNHITNEGDTFLFLPQTTLSEPFKKFPKNWKEYFQIRCSLEYGMKKNLPNEFFPAATFQLSQAVTCLYGMYAHDKKFFTTAEHLTIHVVGASQAFELEGGAPSCVWEEIMHCLPSVKRMNVFFIGPDSLKFGQKMELQCCPVCVGKGRTRSATFSKMTYHDYFNDNGDSSFVKPDFVVAYNTGMYEEYTESWKESLKVMIELDVPCLFTSYDENEAIADFDVLGEVNARTLTDAPVKHPFPADYPVIDLSEFDKFFQSNMYSICFRGRK